MARRGFVTVLFSGPPKYYGLAYLAAIPIFAMLYWQFFPSSFYAPYAKLESAAAEDTRAVREMIDAALHRSVGRAATNVDGYTFAFTVWGALATESGLELTILIELSKRENDQLVDGLLRLVSVRISPVLSGPSLRKGSPVGQIQRAVLLTKDQVDQHTAELIRIAMVEMFPPNLLFGDDAYFIYLSQEEDNRLIRLLYGIRGDPSGISKSFSRMLYFSATVITTIGFGDIVPMTPAARFVVALEGIFGVVLAGLFVNAAMGEKNS